MAAPPTPSQLEAAGRRAAAAAGVGFFIYSGAAGRCRCCSGAHNPAGPFIRAWGPYIGVIRHITAGGLGSRTMETYIRDILVNDPAVPTKCQWSVAPNGDIWWIASGRANHDLNMSRAAYNALTGGTMSLTEFCQNLRGSELVGSTHTMGIEQVAAVAPTSVQARATDYLVAELCRIPRWSGVDVAGHGEVASDRGPGDPNEHMGNVRTRSRTIVSGGTITPPPPAGDEFDMATINDLVSVMRSEGASGGGDPAHNGVLVLAQAMGAQLSALTEAVAKLASDPDLDQATLQKMLDDAVAKAISEGFDADVTLTPRLATLISADANPFLAGGAYAGAPEANADDVEPRTSEAESDAYEGNDVTEADQLTEAEAKARGLDQG